MTGALAAAAWTNSAAGLLYSPWDASSSVRRADRAAAAVTSAFTVRYNTVLNLWRPGDQDGCGAPSPPACAIPAARPRVTAPSTAVLRRSGARGCARRL